MSTAQTCRCLLAAGSVFVGIGLIIKGIVLTGIFFLIVASLLLPILYRLLYIDSKEVQLLSPVVFLVVAIFSLMMFNVVPKSYTIPPKVVYSNTVAQVSTERAVYTTTVSASTVITTVAITTTSAFAVTKEAQTNPVTATPISAVATETSTTTLVTTTSTSAVATETRIDPVITTQIPVVVTETPTNPTTTQVANEVVSEVYRTPSGKRYHLDPDCGGQNSYEVSLEDAVEAGLTPCKKCAGG